jgi:hypothetical protein
MSSKKSEWKDIGFKLNYWDNSTKIDAIVNNVKGLAQASKTPVPLQISPYGTSSRSSNISKKK